MRREAPDTRAATSSSGRIVATTAVGRWCVASFGVGILGFVGMIIAVASGQEGGDTLADNWWISGPALVAGLGFVAAFGAGIFAIVARRERGVAVIVVTVIGAIVTLFIAGEVTTPH